MGEKSYLITSVLWLMFGWLGLHHFYLGRDRHAFVWLWTFGGCFGFGWLVEVLRLHTYVELANGRGSDYQEQLAGIRYHRRPEFSMKRFTGELVFGMMLGFLSATAIPVSLNLDWRLTAAVSCLFVSTGVHTVANIGNEQCTFKICLVGAFCPFPLYIFASPDYLSSVVTYATIMSAIIANWKGTYWRSVKVKNSVHVCHRMLLFLIASCLMVSMIASTVYFNCFVITRDGQKIYVRDGIENILTSPAWADARQTFYTLNQHLFNDGIYKFWVEFNIAMDPEGEEKAYRILNLTSSATDKEVTEHYRQFVRVHHPDKVHVDSEEQRKTVNQKFIEVQQAYEKLSRIKRRRSSEL